MGVVLQAIITCMVGKDFFEALFKESCPWNLDTLRLVFQKMINSTPLQMDDTSLEKLMEFVVMAFKYQLVCAQHCSQILGITLNHFDELRKLVPRGSKCLSALEYARALTVSVRKYETFPTRQANVSSRPGPLTLNFPTNSYSFFCSRRLTTSTQRHSG